MEDISVTKLNLIAYLVKLNDEAILNELNSIMFKHKNPNTTGSILSEEDLVNRALQANKDYEEGNYISQEQLELDAQNW